MDASAILAIIRGEAGLEVALHYAQAAAMSAVNVAEVVTKCIEQDYPEAAALDLIQSSGIEVLPFDEDLAILAGTLRRNAGKGILSLGDRACIATAIRAGATAVTADRVWTTLKLPCTVELIR